MGRNRGFEDCCWFNVFILSCNMTIPRYMIFVKLYFVSRTPLIAKRFALTDFSAIIRVLRLLGARPVKLSCTAPSSWFY